jgi:Mrp family chromosome partitioning ATPase
MGGDGELLHADATVVRPEMDQQIRNEECKLIQQVFLQPGPGKRQTVLFGAVDRRTESATICAQTAQLLAAQIDRSVCVVDADLRNPSLHHHFRSHGAHSRGLLDALRDGDSALGAAHQIGANLSLLPSGARGANAHTALTSDRLALLFSRLRLRFDYVLISAPPLGQCAESMLLGQLSDGVILVVEANATRREHARKVQESLAAARVPLLGVVLNNRTFPIPESLYGRL